MTRIAVAGFQHETNTFAPFPTTLEMFDIPGTWPGTVRGEAMRAALAGQNIPLAGFLAACKHQTIPILWTAAEPGGYVDAAAFDAITGEIVAGVEAAEPDAVYLDLHGAMVTEAHPDAEAEILARLRKAVGPEMPIAVSLDLHGNMSRAFFERATVVTVYRSYPHIDMADTGARAADLLDAALQAPVHGAFRQVDHILPITAQCTLHSPARELYEGIADADILSADMAMGFPPADIPDVGPAIFAYARTAEEAERTADTLAAQLTAALPAFDDRLLSAEDAIAKALAATKTPVVIADVQDNPGAGGTGETTGLLRALVAAEAPDAVFSMLHDPAAAEAAHQAGSGAVLSLDIGGRFTAYSQPYPATVTVEALWEGPFRCTGPMYGGSTADLGKIARLRLNDTGITVVVGSVRTQNADQEMFRVVGIEPKDHAIICVKSAVHFMADYQRIAADILFATAPGANPCRIADIPYTRKR